MKVQMIITCEDKAEDDDMLNINVSFHTPVVKRGCDDFDEKINYLQENLLTNVKKLFGEGSEEE